MKKVFYFIALSVAFLILCLQVVFAGYLGQNEYGFYYVQDDGALAISKTINVDLNGDGIEEPCYFNEAGFLELNNEAQTNQKQVIIGKIQETKLPSEDDDNTEDVDPNMIPPKVQKAINKIRFWCNEDGSIIIPYSKRAIKKFLKLAGYKTKDINRAVNAAGIDWNEHAIIFANLYKKLGYSNARIKILMKAEGFMSDEISNGINGVHVKLENNNFNQDINKIYINPVDFIGLTQEQKMQRLIQLGLSGDKLSEALSFVDSIGQ